MKAKQPHKSKQNVKEFKKTVVNQSTTPRPAAKPQAKLGVKKDYTNWYLCGAILVLTFFVFRSVMQYDFVNWDDDRYVIDNPYLKQLSLENITIYFKQFYFLMYLPLTMLTYVMDTAIAGGLKPATFHTTSLFLHLFNTAMVFVVVAKLERILTGNKNWIVPTVVASLFGLVASHVESVAWIAERKDVLYTAFLLLSFYTYLSYHASGKKLFYWLSFFLFVCSLVSKAQSFPFAFILFFLDGLLLGDYFDKKRLLAKIPFVLVGVFFAAMAILGNRSDSTAFQTLDYNFIERVSFACYGYVVYVVKLFVPFKLSLIHPYPDRVNGSVPFFYWLFLLPVLCVVGLGVYLFNKNKRLVFGIAFYSFSIVIVLQLFAYHDFLMAERYSYVSSIGVFYILGYGIDALLRSRAALRPLVLAVFGLYLAVMCFVTLDRLSVWQNSNTMWDDVKSKYPRVIVAHYNQANYKAEKLDLQGAMDCYNKALQINPNYVPALSNRGVTYGKMNNPKAALADFEHVARLDSKYKDVYSNMGNVNVMLGDLPNALKNYDKALQLTPDFPDAIFNRGQARSSAGDLQGALKDFEHLIQVKKDYPSAYHSRGMILLNLGRRQEALADFQVELQANPNNFESLYARGACYLGLKQFDQALADLNRVVQSNPKLAMPYYQRALTFIGKGAQKEACADLQMAYSLGYQPAMREMQQYCK